MQYNDKAIKAIKAKKQNALHLKDRENKPACTDNAGRLFKALLGRNFQLADKTIDAAEMFRHSKTTS